MFCCCAEDDRSAVQVIDTAASTSEAAPGERSKAEQIAEAEVGIAIEEVAADDDSFVVHLDRQDDEGVLGLKGDFADEKVIHVCRVTAEGNTAIARYNSSVPDGQKIKVGDYFTAVNGVSYLDAMPPQKVSDVLREQLLNSRSVKVTVRRPELFECKIEKKGLPMGLELSYSITGIGLIIVKITAGAVENCAPEIRVGDRIVGVGGTAAETDPEKLLATIKATGDTVPLLLSRPAAVP